MAKTRTFLAVAASGALVQKATQVIKQLKQLDADIKWVEPQNLHWTLHFLGEIDDNEVFEVCQAVERGAEQVEAFGLEARGVGAFPRLDSPRTLWIGAAGGRDQMEALHDAIDAALEPLGFRRELRRYVPHLTLGRAGRSLSREQSLRLAKELAELADFAAGTQQVDEVTVFASRLRREGPDYVALGSAPLG